MREFATPAALLNCIGQSLGASQWLTVNQARIDAFAAVSGDDNWIHVDTVRAARELPGGLTIAHGMLTLSLVTALSQDILRVQCARAINYGCDKVRYTHPVTCGTRLRLHRTLTACGRMPDGGIRAAFDNVMEIEGTERPALIARTISVFYS